MKSQKQNKKELIFTFLFIFLCSIGAAMYAKWKQTGTPFVPETILYFCTVFLVSICTWLMAVRLLRYIETKTNLVKQVIPALLGFYVGVYIISYLSITLGVFVWFLVKGRSLVEFFPHLFKYELKPNTPTGNLMIWLLLATLMFFYVLWKRAMEREQKLREEKLLYQYETLKQQVNPHFLFNSLNTLSSLINTFPVVAESFTNKLSLIYRYILENSGSDKISLQNEISFVTNYFYLYKIRDEDKINLHIDLKNCDQCEVVPVSLQVLVENALKHNMATREKQLNIDIYCEEKYIVVKNNLQKMTTLVDSSKIGLKNLSERIKLITGMELLVNETADEFIVKMPII